MQQKKTILNSFLALKTLSFDKTVRPFKLKKSFESCISQF